MNALLQALGLGLGGLAYALLMLALLRGVRSAARIAVAIYWDARTRMEVADQVARVIELSSRRPVARGRPAQRRRAA